MSEQPQDIPSFDVHTAKFSPLPELGGAEAILYRSDDGTRLAGSFKESGRHEMVLPFDEFIYVIAGSTHITVEGRGDVHLEAGNACYLQAGQRVVFEHSPDFHDVAVLVSDTEISY